MNQPFTLFTPICYPPRMVQAQHAQTPMLQQYFRIREEHPDPNTILFFRLGDFYEMFFEDAVIAAKILDITLTTRNRNDPNPIPLCGVPYHAADAYIARLIEAGKKVAICEQVEDPKTAKGVVKREVLQVITPGLGVSAQSLPSREANFLVAVTEDQGRWGLAVIDISTGDFRATELCSVKALRDELERLEPREVILSLNTALPWPWAGVVTHLPAEQFLPQGLPALEGAAMIAQQSALALAPATAIWHYLRYAKLAGPDLERYVARIAWYQPTDYVVIDDVTKRNLELSRTMHEGQRHGSLVWHLDRTATAMGARALKQWTLYPLREVAPITARQDAIQQLLDAIGMQQGIAAALRPVADMERLIGRLMTNHGNARDLLALRDSLSSIPALHTTLQPARGLLGALRDRLDPCDAIVAAISRTLVDDPPLALKEGHLIRDGVDPELDELRNIRSEGKNFIARLEQEEKQKSGIHSLKVRYNKVFGYYIEITHTHKDKIPDRYIRKQTLANAERFITPELKAYEEKVITAEDRIVALEYEHFVQLREAVKRDSARMRATASAVGEIDALWSLAAVAQEGNYCRPTLVDAPVVKIREGRHPVIERLLTNERFVPNDCALGGDAADAKRLLVITGPNMAGKSTVMRQVGLITLLAHMGSFVPAREATIGLTDRIFTRVGASDNLARGHSTFMVEMSEAATILTEATERSLILIDELGRGTSTYDGISIAWAVAEYLIMQIRARTLFATHYHELAALAEAFPSVGNVTMAVKEWNDEIIFLRTLTAGAANRSYGIQVAKLAGLPHEVTTRAQHVLADLESENLRDHHRGRSGDNSADTGQISLFAQPDPKAEALKARLAALDVNRLTPLEALNLLVQLKAEVES